MVRRCWGVLVALALAAGVAVAQSDGNAASSFAAQTDAAQETLAKHQNARDALLAQEAALVRRYDTELAAVDQFKRQRSSWRRDRQLQDAQAAALDTSKKIGMLSRQIRELDGRITADRRRLAQAIDLELANLSDGPRRRSLVANRAAIAPRLVKAHKINVPDGEIDPLADPEELDQQAQALRTTEADLMKQMAALDAESRRLGRIALLVKAHERAGDLAVRDNEEPRRTGVTGTGGRDHSAVESPEGAPPSEPVGDDDVQFTGEATALALSEVIDPETGDALRRTGNTTDPAARAEVARRARSQVAARLETLRKQRAAVEARAASLRKK